MNITEEELDHLKARVAVTEVTLAYAIANLSAKFPDIKPAVIKALHDDEKANENERPLAAKALYNMAELINRFEFNEKQ